MLRPMFLSMSFAIGCLLFVNSASADLLNFSWTDDQGQVGEFVLDTDLGYSASAISEFSYILGDGSPTPAGFQVVSFDGFNSDQAWNIFTDVEGITFIFGVPVSEPFITDPEFYRENFQAGNFINNDDTRTWDSISVTTVTVPEPNSIALLSILALSFAGLRRKSK